MKKFKLTLSERLMITKLLNEKGNNLPFSELKEALKVSEKAQVEPEELKACGFVEGKSMWKDKGSEKEIEFSDEQHTLLIKFIEKKDEEKGFSMDGGLATVSMIDKVKGTENEK